ncbi:hypothetical protein HDU85_005807 [Gaertneriomyces sp. JEL0708]|nr:hypothetical protein HDU85_005807 [Gaertneriomyces sp. JEL0708]
MAIADLAQVSKMHKASGRSPGIPITVVVTALLGLSLLAVSLVLGLMFDKSAQSSVNQLSDGIIQADLIAANPASEDVAWSVLKVFGAIQLDNQDLLIERATGYLISSDAIGSTSEIVGDPALGEYVRFKPHESPDTTIAAVGTAIRNHFNGYANIASSTTEITRLETQLGSEKWFINIQSIDVNPSQWIVVVAMPRADFYGAIERTRKTSVAFATSIAVVGAVLGAIICIIVLRPLAVLAESMKKLTKFDFSSLEGAATLHASKMSDDAK